MAITIEQAVHSDGTLLFLAEKHTDDEGLGIAQFFAPVGMTAEPNIAVVQAQFQALATKAAAENAAPYQDDKLATYIKANSGGVKKRV